MIPPIVSCLMPTADRRQWVPLAIAAFLAQNFPSRELIVLDDGQDPVGDLIPADPRIRYVRIARGKSLGAKRNETCRLARGEILVNWDDDDWSAPWRLSYQVEQLKTYGADICGLDRLWFFDPSRELAWRYRYPPSRTPWVAGGTQCFRRGVWERHPYPDIPIGEDDRWIAGAIGARVLPLARDDFYVASVHRANTCPRQTNGTRWNAANPVHVRSLLGLDWQGFTASFAPPLVSCIMPTGGRRAFVELSLQCFLTQDYSPKELVIVDDGAEPVGDLVAGQPLVRYVRLLGRRSIGAKRNAGCGFAQGDVIVQWDDADWFGPARLSRQIAPLLEGRADITALETRWIACLSNGDFWAASPAVQRRMFYADVHAGTLAYRREMWASGIRYTDHSLAEDATFLHAAIRVRSRLLRIANSGLFVYMRHRTNAWPFEIGTHLDPRAWCPVSPPVGFGAELLSQYRLAAAQLPGQQGQDGTGSVQQSETTNRVDSQTAT